MNHEEQATAYKDFFENSAAGVAFMQEVERQIADCHEQAEANGTLARDCTQQAKGARAVLRYIQSVMTEVKKGKA